MHLHIRMHDYFQKLFVQSQQKSLFAAPVVGSGLKWHPVVCCLLGLWGYRMGEVHLGFTAPLALSALGVYDSTPLHTKILSAKTHNLKPTYKVLHPQPQIHTKP